jgi:hypothetical protein
LDNIDPWCFSDPVEIFAGSLLSAVATGDPEWQNHIDGVDVLFLKTGSGSSTSYTLKATNPGTFKYRLSLANETGTEIHVKGRKLPDIIRNGVTLKDRNGATTTVILTVPTMPANVGTTPYPLSAAERAEPAFVLTGNRPVRAHPDDRTDEMPISVSWVTSLPTGITSCEGVTTWQTGSLGDGAVVRCIKVDGLEIRKHHEAHVHVAYEFRWKNRTGWGSSASDATTAFRAGFNFTSTTRIELDTWDDDLLAHSHGKWHRLPSALRAKLLSDFESLWGTSYVGSHALGLTLAGEKMTAIGGFLFNAGAEGLPDITVRAFTTKPSGDACNSALTPGTGTLQSQYTTGEDGFYFLWQKGDNNATDPLLGNTFASGYKYYLALCDFTAAPDAGTAMPFAQLYWPSRQTSKTLGYREFNQEDFFVSGPTRLAFQSQPITGRRNYTLGTVKVALLDAFGNVMTVDSTSKVTLSAVTSSGTSAALVSSYSSQPLADRTLTNGTATWTGLKFTAAGLYKLNAASNVVPGIPDEKSLPINISN